jgi:hypothetical protein
MINKVITITYEAQPSNSCLLTVLFYYNKPCCMALENKMADPIAMTSEAQALTACPLDCSFKSPLRAWTFVPGPSMLMCI